MIKKTSLLLVFVSSIFLANAQLHSGIIVGLNLSKVKYDYKLNNEVLHPGAIISIPFNIGIKDLGAVDFSLQPELVGSMKGQKQKNDTMAYFFSANYVEIPLMIKTRFGNGLFKPYINFGPYLAWHAMYYDQIKLGDEWIGTDPVTPDTRYMNTLDYGGSLGVGFNSNGFIFEIRYSQGFGDIFKNKGSRNFGITPLESKFSNNSVLSICIGILVIDPSTDESDSSSDSDMQLD